MPTVLRKVHKQILAHVYCQSLTRSEASVSSLSDSLALEIHEAESLCGELIQQRLLMKSDRSLSLTSSGRSALKVVLVGGVFDIIHPGHVHFLEGAKAFGDTLVVSVARDKTVAKMRGRQALNDEQLRVQLVQSIRFVDVALLGSEKDILDTVERTRPDIIVLGYDQAHDERQIEAGSAQRGVKVKVVRLTSYIPRMKTSRVLSTAPEKLTQT